MINTNHLVTNADAGNVNRFVLKEDYVLGGLVFVQ